MKNKVSLKCNKGIVIRMKRNVFRKYGLSKKKEGI
jgi:hypothetical protein